MVVVTLFSIVTMVIAYDFTKNVRQSQQTRGDAGLENLCENGKPINPSTPHAFCDCLTEGKPVVVCKMFLV